MTMSKCGVLVLTLPIHRVLPCVGVFLKQASQMISNVIYIKLQPSNIPVSNGSNSIVADNLNANNRINQYHDLINVIPNIYRIASVRAPHHDVRVIIEKVVKQLQFEPEILLTNDLNDTGVQQLKTQLTRNCQIISLEQSSIDECKRNADAVVSNGSNQHCNKSDSDDQSLIVQSDDYRTYDHTCLGGTFDVLHNGHKVFLNEALLRTKKRLVIGVTDQCMLRSKLLPELITPIEQRIQFLNSYLNDVHEHIEYDIRSIQDPFGPSIEIPELECLIVSEETLKGGHAVNNKRAERQMNPLNLYVTKLVSEHSKQVSVEEDKISSSSLRLRKLGTIIREPTARPNLPEKPYLIGLTGGICSGKSTILQVLKSLGAGIINCDQLAHQTYSTKGSETYEQIKQTFGNEIVNADGSIDRRKLGEIVFKDATKLQTLNDIVWPATECLIKQQLQILNEKHDVIFLEAALLLDANWDDKFHQIWVSIIPEEEAIKRLHERNGLSREQAIHRIRSQISNADKVARANVVFCSQWEFSVTEAQVLKAWNILNQKYLKKNA